MTEWAPKTIVKLTFAIDPATGELDHLAPFFVNDKSGAHTGAYEDEPQVLAQIGPRTRFAYFEAEWIAGEWKFGQRVDDQDW
jgi:hypothetical protein